MITIDPEVHNMMKIHSAKHKLLLSKAYETACIFWIHGN